MTDMCEGVAVGVITEPEDKYLNVKVVEIDFHESYPTANNKTKVKAPHWPAAKYQFKYSAKPAVLKVGKKSKAKVKVEVDCKGVSGNGKLKGVINGFELEGDIKLSNGTQDVEVTLLDPPDSIRWLKGQVSWGVEGCGLSSGAGNTFVELFFVLANPAVFAFFRKAGVWAEALRFLFENGRVSGVKDKKSAAIEVTECCFKYKYHKYEITGGAPQFGGGDNVFMLEGYMDTIEGEVNCYDQTYAVIVFSGALGVEVGGLYMNIFGYLSKTNLVGWGECNNPFPDKKLEAEKKRLRVPGFLKEAAARMLRMKPEDYLVVAPDDPDRQAFGNHMYCLYQANTFDACAGPEKGSRDLPAYIAANIDATTSLNRNPFPGTIHDVRDYEAVGAAVIEVK
jgi:hypothetical protein